MSDCPAMSEHGSPCVRQEGHKGMHVAFLPTPLHREWWREARDVVFGLIVIGLAYTDPEFRRYARRRKAYERARQDFSR